jgi:hypothetical protein
VPAQFSPDAVQPLVDLIEEYGLQERMREIGVMIADGTLKADMQRHWEALNPGYIEEANRRCRPLLAEGRFLFLGLALQVKGVRLPRCLRGASVDLSRHRRSLQGKIESTKSQPSRSPQSAGPTTGWPLPRRRGNLDLHRAG